MQMFVARRGDCLHVGLRKFRVLAVPATKTRRPARLMDALMLFV